MRTDDFPDVEVLLSAADKAVAAGEALASIEDLSEFNRVRPDARIERRLVEVRHLAFAELSRTPGRSVWPAQFPDPFPGEDGVPAIQAADLSGELLGGAIVNHGCLRVNGLLDGDAAARFREHIDRTFDARDGLDGEEPPESGSPWFVPFAPGRAEAQRFDSQGQVRTVDAPRVLYAVVDLLVRTRVHQAVTDYFRERPAMIAGKWALRRTPNGKLGTDFHQDGAFLGEGIRTANCWIALSECGPGTGRPGIDVIPRRFAGVIKSRGDSVFEWSLSESAARAAAPEAPVVGPVFAAGDAIFFDERMPHRTSVGGNLTTRYAIESWFVAPSSYQAKHVPIVI